MDVRLNMLSDEKIDMFVAIDYASSFARDYPENNGIREGLNTKLCTVDRFGFLDAKDR